MENQAQALNKIGNKLVEEESGDKGLSANKVRIDYIGIGRIIADE
jgi:hypothetical protein